MAHKANEMSKYRTAPEINPNSRRIIASKSKSSVQSVPKFGSLSPNGSSSPVINDRTADSLLYDDFKKQLPKENISIKANDKKKADSKAKEKKSAKKSCSILSTPLSPDAFKFKENAENKEKLKEKEQEIEDNADVINRTKKWKTKLDKKIEEERKIKLRQELEECTFKPKLSQEREFNDTGSMITKDYVTGKSQKSINIGNLSNREKIKKFISEVDIIPCNYSQISPVPFTIKHEFGFNVKEFLSKARPMANYSLIEEEI